MYKHDVLYRRKKEKKKTHTDKEIKRSKKYSVHQDQDVLGDIFLLAL